MNCLKEKRRNEKTLSTITIYSTKQLKAMWLLNKILNFLIDPTGILRKQEWLKDILGWDKQLTLLSGGVQTPISKLFRKFCMLGFVMAFYFIWFVIILQMVYWWTG